MSISDKIAFIVLGILSFVVYFFIWKGQTPYPLQLNWDIYEHITLANKIAEGHLSFLTSRISDTFTFNSYSPLFHILLAIPKILFRADLLGIYYYLEFFYFTATVVATFLLAKRIFNNLWVAFMAGIFSIFIFENFMVYASFFLIPQNLSALLTILALIYVSKEKVNKFLLGALMLGIFLMHYIIGLVGVLIIMGYLLMRKAPSKVLTLSIFILSVILLLILASNYLGNFALTSREEAIHFMFPLNGKLGFLLDWYSLSWLFLPISYYFIVKSGSKEQKIILSLALLILGLSLAPFSYFLKFFVFDHFFLNILLAAGLGILIFNLPKLIKISAVIWINIALLVVFFKSQSSYKEMLYFDDKYSHISYGEIETGRWLTQNIKKDTFLISDPATQYVLEAMSGVNTQGGAYMSEETRKTLSEINGVQDMEKIKNKLKNVKDRLDFENKVRKNTLLVLGGRYFAWQKLPEKEKLSVYYNIWRPKLLSAKDWEYIKSITADPRFNIIYQNNELVIIQI